MNRISGSAFLLSWAALSSWGWTFTELQTGPIASDTNLVWRQTAPGMAGSNRGIYADAVDPDKVWVVPDFGNDYLTTDGGQHWETIIPPDGTWSGRPQLSDTCVRSDPKDPSVVISLRWVGSWATPSQAIDVSTDGGRTFFSISGSYASGSEPDSAWYCATPHPDEAGTWYVGNGNDFKEIRTGVNPNPVQNVDTSVSKVWKITDITQATRTITPVSNTGMDAVTSVFDIICHPDTATYPDMLFAATSTGLYRKDDASSAWVRILQGCIKADAQWDGATLTLYALQQATYTDIGHAISSSGGVFVSTSPETATTSSGWTDLTAGLRVDLSQLTIQPAGLYPGFIETWFGYADPAGDTFAKPTAFFPNFDEIRVDPTDADRIYLSNVTRGNFYSVVTGSIWASLDGGSSWFAAARIGNGFEKEAFWAAHQPGKTARNIPLQVHEKYFPDYFRYDNRGCRTMTMAADGTVYASINKGYYTVKYDADADEWTSVDNTQVGHVYFGHGNGDLGTYGVFPDIHRPGEMFMLQQESSVWKTTGDTHPDFPGVVGAVEVPAFIDEGPSWAPGSPYIAPTALVQHPIDTNVFYTLSPRTGEFSKTSDNGLTRTVKGEPVPLAETSSLKDMIYWRHLRISADGNTIYTVAEVVDDDNYPMGKTTIYDHVSTKGIYKSVDDGVTWSVMNNGLPQTAAGRVAGSPAGSVSACIKGLTMDPQDSQVLYAAAKRYYALGGGYTDGGLYRSADGAATWSAETLPASVKSLWDVQLQVHAGVANQIYIAGGGDGSESDWGEGGVWVAEYKPNGGYVSSDWKKVFDHPFCTHVAVSPFDTNRLMVATAETGRIGDLNPGLYFTLSGDSAGDGSDWVKINCGRGPMQTSSIAFDSGNPDRLWVSGAASGTYALDVSPLLTENWLAIDYYAVSGTDVVLGFTNGPVSSTFALYSKTNLMDEGWTELQSGLQSDETGAGSVTNPVIHPQEYFRLLATGAMEPPSSGIIPFTAPDFSNGLLDGQQNWNAESGWTVDTSGFGSVMTPDTSSAAVLNIPVQLSAGESYSLSINFEFGGTYATPSGFVYAFLAGLKEDSAAVSEHTDNLAADANIQLYGGEDRYRLLHSWAPLAGASSITGSLDAGDVLQFDYTLTLGSTATDSSYTVRLQNLTDGADTGTGTVAGIDAFVYDALTGTGAYAFFQSINPGNNGSGLSGVQVNSVTVSQ